MEGRIAAMILTGLAGDLTIYNVHMDHQSSDRRESQLRKIAEHQTGKTRSHIMMTGDWNFVMSAADRMSPKTGGEQLQPDRKTALWDKLFPKFTERFQPGPTRRGQEGGSWARLGRAYSNMHPAELMSRRVGSNVLSSRSSTRQPSDHAPLFVSILNNTPGHCGAKFRRRISDWIFRNAQWAAHVDTKAGKLRLFDLQNWWIGLSVLKGIFHEVAEEMMATRSLRDNLSSERKLSITMGALKAIRVGNMASYQLCLHLYPDLGKYVAFSNVDIHTASPATFPWGP